MRYTAKVYCCFSGHTVLNRSQTIRMSSVAFSLTRFQSRHSFIEHTRSDVTDMLDKLHLITTNCQFE